ncbi:MAG TPA: hypothetical protein VGC80_14195, partial [Acetobacteraceae bacterium]
MSGTLGQAIEHARASADVLDDPDDVENRAIRQWMGHHLSFSRRGKHYVVGTALLPLRWRALAVRFTFRQDAVALLRPMLRDRAAMAGMRKTVTELHGGGFCAADAAVVDMLAEALVTGRAW